MKKFNRLAILVSLAAAVTLLPSASFADDNARRTAATQGERTVELGDDVSVIRQELVRTQRTIREALINASLSTDQMSEAYALFTRFTRNYAGAVQTNDPMLTELSFDELFEGKIGTPLRERFGLQVGETDFLRFQLNQWVTGELVILDSTRLRDDLVGGR